MSTLPLEGDTMYMKVSAIESTYYEIAEDSACANAIKYIGESINMVIGHFNYT
jgi:hypothetical protein